MVVCSTVHGIRKRTYSISFKRACGCEESRDANGPVVCNNICHTRIWNIYMYMYVDEYVRIYICINTYAYVKICIYIYTCIYMYNIEIRMVLSFNVCHTRISAIAKFIKM